METLGDPTATVLKTPFAAILPLGSIGIPRRLETSSISVKGERVVFRTPTVARRLC
jgi:hypothetical protein